MTQKLHPALPPALPGERLRLRTAAGDCCLYAHGAGPPLLLIHSVNAAASAAEVRPLHLHFAARRQVFSLDLPGYGLSHRADLAYSPALMTGAIDAAVEAIHARCGEAPIDALALSLSAEFLARSGARSPAAYRSLALVSPTGFRGKAVRRGAPDSDRGMAWLYACLRGPPSLRPGWGHGIFRQLTRPGVIRYFLERTWGSKRIDEELWRYDVITADQAAAEFAPLRFLSGYLFSDDIHAVYETLPMPVWMSHGVRGDFTDYRGQALIANRPNWRITRYPTGALPHFELPDRFYADYENFLVAAGAPAA